MNWMTRLTARFSRTPRPPCWPSGVQELTVEELHQSRERGIELRMRHPAFAMLADDIAQMFDEAGATNYVEYTVCSEKYGPMRVCIQRLDGETPAMQNERLRKRIAELEANAHLSGGEAVPSNGWLDSCDNCASQEEGGHYCLLHSRQMKNMDTLRCSNWTPKPDEKKSNARVSGAKRTEHGIVGILNKQEEKR